MKHQIPSNMKTMINLCRKLLLVSILLLFGSNANSQHSAPFITIIQPNDAGIHWVIGSTYWISWTSNFVNPVKIDLVDYTNINTPVTIPIAASVQGSTYTWTIPSGTVVGTNYKIKITSTVNNSYFAESANFFTIASMPAGGSIKVLQPSLPNIKLQRGSPYLIAWEDNLPGNVKIELVDDSPGGATQLIATDVEGSTYIWNVPSDQLLGDLFKIKVSSVIDGNLFDLGDNHFSIVATLGGTIEVLQPSIANLSWVRGSSYLISWNDNLTEPLNIALVNTATSATIPIAENVSGSTYSWNIEPAIPLADTYKIKVSSSLDPTINAMSANTFSIVATVGSITVLNPNESNISWARGNAYSISWVDNLAESVIIELVNYGVTPNTYTQIGNTIGSTLVYNVPANLPLGDMYKIKVLSSVSPSTIFDHSNNYFSIVASSGSFIEVLQPMVSGIKWVRGTTNLISWNDDVPDPVNIELINTVTNQTYPVANNIAGSTYLWTIDSSIPLSNKYKIRISSSLNPSIAGVSLHEFEITASIGSITVLNPNNPGINWTRGQSYLISWIDNLNEPVYVELVNYGVTPTTFTPLGILNGTTLHFTVPANQPLGSHYKIKVLSTISPSTIYDHSDNFFSIKASSGNYVTVLQPNGGEQLLTGSSYLISWIDDIPEPVKIELVTYPALTVVSTIETSAVGTTLIWNVPVNPALVGSDYRILISSVYDPTINDISNSNFSIVQTLGGNIQIFHPNGGEILGVGSSYLISWIDDVIEPMTLELVNYSTTPPEVSLIATNVVGSTYVWDIPVTQTLGTQFKIRVSSILDLTVMDESDATFSLIVWPKNNVTVFPNPATSFLNVKFDEDIDEVFTLTLTNRFTMPVLTQEVNTAQEKELQIPTEGLPNGVYFLILRSNKHTITEKVVIKH
ncbi:MAG TPA: Ser-Thr-rich GPI-anchored membrane family protein [Bacteroidales bacterium]|nr:Ser-Thr-rich GPI-anchored membrane family protein [Bacteroidales bacterium]